MVEKEMRTQFIELSKLKPYENNAKKHPEEQIQDIANSIKRFGWRQPILLDKNSVIIAGHGRYMAAQKLGLKQALCAYADDLTEEQVKAYRLADNKLNESEWDFDILDGELDTIVDIDMGDFGFTGVDLLGDDSFLGESDEDDKPKSKKDKTCTCPKCGFSFEVI